MENLQIWNKLKTVPQEVQKSITGGRLKGMTDIKPQWRYQVMTQVFGAIGFGWYYDITSQWIEEGANGERCAFTNVNLFIQQNGEWSKPIPGTGGSSFIANEKNGAYTSDECFKMALTDALSVAMAKVGVGADIYMGHGSKYTAPIPNGNTPAQYDKPKIDVWMNQSQFDRAISENKAKESLNWYDGKTVQEDGKVYSMKSEYRKQLKEQLNAK